MCRFLPWRRNNNFFKLLGTFESEEITHVEGDVNPVRDIEIINEELRLKDEEYLMATIKKTESLMRSDKKVKTEWLIIFFSF